MDGRLFDRWTRSFAGGATRRQTLQGVVGASLAGMLAHLSGEAVAACVKPGKKGCEGPKNKKCCDGARCKGGNRDKEGRCKCKGKFKQCGAKCVNTKTDKNNCGRCNNTCTGGNTCKNGVCTGQFGCRAGDTICNNFDMLNCPGTTNPDCFCMTDVAGTAHCSDFNDFFCSDCTSNADCGSGFICARGDFGQCGCGDVPESNGNVCLRATCSEVSDGRAGRGGPESRLLRR